MLYFVYNQDAPKSDDSVCICGRDGFLYSDYEEAKEKAFILAAISRFKRGSYPCRSKIWDVEEKEIVTKIQSLGALKWDAYCPNMKHEYCSCY